MRAASRGFRCHMSASRAQIRDQNGVWRVYRSELDGAAYREFADLSQDGPGRFICYYSDATRGFFVGGV
jgi:hypothetical protein